MKKLVAKMLCLICNTVFANEVGCLDHAENGMCNNPTFAIRYFAEEIEE